MTILLINDNPVVSRLLALCTRDNDMVLEEVTGVQMIQHESYDVVFIDEGSYVGEVLNISKMIRIGKKILLSTVDVEMNDFNMTIEKPFLPSQIIEVLENIEVSQESEGVVEETDLKTLSDIPLSEVENNLHEIQEDASEEEISVSEKQVLDEDELAKIKELLEMDDDIEIADSLSEEEIETRKVEAIKEQLIADGLEIVGEEEIVEELSTSEDIIIFSSEEKKSKKKNKSAKKKSKKSKKKQKKTITFSEEELEQIEDAVQVIMGTLKPKQMKKLLKGKEIEVHVKLEDHH